MHISKLAAILPDIVVVVCCAISAGLSVFESKLNLDPHHWGLMYANAADLLNGRIPYREIFIQYGLLTTWIHAFSLQLFGNTVVSIGIITGLFYSLSIYLCYRTWQKILPKWHSCLATLLMFLVHPYIVYPWANYISYTFLLAAFLLLVASPAKSFFYLLSGVFLGLSVMARHTAILSTLTPVYLFFFVTYSRMRQFRTHMKNILLFHAGMIGVLGAYAVYILNGHMLDDWILQNITVIGFYNIISPWKKLSIFLGHIVQWPPYTTSDVRMILYSMVFVNACVICIMAFCKYLRNDYEEKWNILFLYSLVTLCGYIQALHMYELFRLQNASSLGIGLLIFSGYILVERTSRWKFLLLHAASICFVLYLSFTLYLPWNNYQLGKNLCQPKGIDMLRGKLYDQQTRAHYENLHTILNTYSQRLPYLINLTPDCYIPMLCNSLQKVQRTPFYHRRLVSYISEDEYKIFAALARQEKALVVLISPWDMPPNYEIVSILHTPEQIIFFEKPQTIYIAIPRSMLSGH